MHERGLLKAIRYFGSQRALAEAIGVKQQVISHWLNRELTIPFKYVLKMCLMTKGQITLAELAPNNEMNTVVDDLIKLRSHKESAPTSLAQTTHSTDESLALPTTSTPFPPSHVLQKADVIEEVNASSLCTPLMTHYRKKGTYAMREYSKISPQFWVGNTGRAIRKMGLSTQLMALYLMTSPHATMLGIYYAPIAYIAHDTGIHPNKVLSILQQLKAIDFCSYDEESEYVWVHAMASYQVAASLDPRDKRVAGVNDLFQSLPELPFLTEFYERYHRHFLLEARKQNEGLSATPISHVVPATPSSDLPSDVTPKTFTTNVVKSPFDAPCKPLRSQEQKQEQEQEHKQEQEVKQKQLVARDDRSPAIAVAPSLSPPPQTTTALSLPLIDHSEFLIDSNMVAEWQQLYPAIDVLQELRKIRGWNLANPDHRKTRRGILKHINRWLADENDAAKHKATRPPNTLLAHNQTVAQQWLEHGQHKTGVTHANK
jgi:DNA-binding transcriptional regulator YdaS (Cro superfamily)